MRLSIAALLVVALGAGALLLPSCSSSSTPNRLPIGETFPTVTGESLEGESVTLPSAVAGEPAILLVGYLQEIEVGIECC